MATSRTPFAGTEAALAALLDRDYGRLGELLGAMSDRELRKLYLTLGDLADEIRSEEGARARG